eukprot:TRINITY_DN10150_c0_g3_i2.p1 TRINITY_DN10150_c0_g3~~TRINITY_DN10150_c0_g3_i2.p1  ORF type:complete len:455 (+),score=66.97 TRINITY_DN10150_c0_g3_i2:75-1439(+)
MFGLFTKGFDAMKKTALLVAASCGKLEDVESNLASLTLTAEHLDWIGQALVKAAEKGHFEVFVRLMDVPGAYAATNDHQALKSAVAAGYTAIVDYILCSFAGDASIASVATTVLRLACANGHHDVLDLLLAQPSIEPTKIDNMALLKAAERGHLDMVNRLLEYPFLDATYSENVTLIAAVSNNHVSIVERLLQIPSLDPSIPHNEPLRTAIEKANLHLSTLFLSLPTVRRSVDWLEFARLAASQNHPAIFEKFLTDPLFPINKAYVASIITEAAELGHHQILAVLDKHAMLEGAVFDVDEALMRASINGHVFVVQWLLKGRRLDTRHMLDSCRRSVRRELTEHFLGNERTAVLALTTADLPRDLIDLFATFLLQPDVSRALVQRAFMLNESLRQLSMCETLQEFDAIVADISREVELDEEIAVYGYDYHVSARNIFECVFQQVARYREVLEKKC